VSKGPESIIGVQQFKGQLFHSSNWDHDIDFQGKDVVVIGNGASANQFVLWILENVEIRSLTQVVRSEQWVAPKNNKAVGNIRKWCVLGLLLSSL
jgi:cation diffusion facilitator CzcD-associated flavoprotein CzcO